MPEGTKPLVGFENGGPLGDVRFLNFGDGINAIPVGDDYVTITADTGILSWDAVVDASITASVPKDRLFKGIGEALTYLGPSGLNLNRALVLVRPGTYTETANWTNPNAVFLFSAAPFVSTISGGGTDRAPVWQHMNFSGSTGYWNIHGIEIDFLAGTTTKASGFSGSATFKDCSLDLRQTISSFTVCSGQCVYDNCSLISMRNLGGDVFITNSDVLVENVATVFTIATRSLRAYGLSYGGNSTMNWALPTSTVLHIEENFSRWGSVIGANVNLTCASPLHLSIYSSGIGGTGITVTGTPARVVLLGTFLKIIVPTCSGALYVGGEAASASAGVFDVTGPGIVYARCRDSGSGGAVILRGTNLIADIALQYFLGGSGTGVKFIGLKNSSARITVNFTNSGGTDKPYSFDANCDHNLVIFEKTSGFGAAGTNLGGATNIVLPDDLTAGGGLVTGLATTVVSETAYSQAPVVGVSSLAARGDHSHGTPQGATIVVA